MKQYVIIITLISTLLGGSSCKEWLKVDSEDRIMEDALFQSESGFFTALNGVYVHLLNTNLYGRTLTAGTFDILRHDKTVKFSYIQIFSKLRTPS